MLNKKTIRDLDLSEKKVLVRVDFNVPLNGKTVMDDTRIKAALPTIDYLLECNAAIILISHLGRPGGEFIEEYSLKPVADYLGNLVDVNVHFCPDCVGELARKASAELPYGAILVLENTRFHSGEENNDPEMGKELASLAEIYINDAFGTAHRAHASNVGVADYLPAAAGLLLEKEINYLGNVISEPDRPFIAILGGAKVSGKIGVINNLIDKVDQILIGGGMANTFFAGQGLALGDSLVEEGSIDLAKELLTKAGDKIVLPRDVIIGDSFSNEAAKKTMQVDNIPAGWRILDIGPDTLYAFSNIIKDSKTVVWNGPMGVFEFPKFAQGTFELARIVSESDAMTIIGGGDSAAAIMESGLKDQISHISTGGGASLQMLEGKKLPGLEALADK